MRARRSLHFLILAAALAAAPGASLADDAVPDEPDGMDIFRESVRETTSGFAQAVDSFFSDAEYEEDENKTSLSLKFGAEYLTKDDWDFDLQPRLRLRLPQTERKLLLEIVGERNPDDSEDPFFLTDQFDDSDSDIGRLAVRLKVFQEINDIRLTPELGVKFSDLTPHVFTGVRASGRWAVTDNWSFFASQRFRVHTDRGPDSRTVLRADRPVRLWKDDLFRASFDLNWRNDEDGVAYTPGLAMYAPVDEHSAFAFETSLRVETEPSHEVQKGVATIRYRTKFIYDWWTAEFAPRVEFAEEHDYDASYGARAQLELEF